MRWAAAFAILLLLAGCAQVSDEPAPTSTPAARKGVRAGADPTLAFSAPKVIDEVRAGGEPVIAITPKGTILVASHPGYTHYRANQTPPPPPTELIVPSQGQSYMWRSVDGGQTFLVVGTLPTKDRNAGPRGVGQGVSDPDFSVAPSGRIYFTDLEALAAISVSWSDDDGVSWLEGNDVVMEAVDRPWLATYAETVYVRANPLSTPRPDVMRSDNGGGTWFAAGRTPDCEGDILANPTNGTLYVRCPNDGSSLAVSHDEGRTWTNRPIPLRSQGPIVPEVALDANGTLYVAADPSGRDLQYAWSKDEGQTWTNLSLRKSFPEVENGTFLWPWTSAGSEGRLSVTFYASPTRNAVTSSKAHWFVYNAIIVNATTDSPTVYASKLTPTPFKVGAICLDGTKCQAGTGSASDRRLGDFFETTIDHDGFLHVVYSDTQAKPDDSISHVGYVRQVGGPRLVFGPVAPGFPTQG